MLSSHLSPTAHAKRTSSEISKVSSQPFSPRSKEYCDYIVLNYFALVDRFKPVDWLLLLSHFSRVRLCATPQTAAHQAPPSLGFSRQEHWSGVPFPSPMHESDKFKWSRSVVSNSWQPDGLQPTRLLCPWAFPGKSTGVGCHCLLHRLTSLPKCVLGGYQRESKEHFLFLNRHPWAKYKPDLISWWKSYTRGETPESIKLRVADSSSCHVHDLSP